MRFLNFRNFNKDLVTKIEKLGINAQKIEKTL